MGSYMDNDKNEKPAKKTLPLKQRLKAAFNGVSRKNIMGIAKDTLKDLRRPKEIGLLVVSSFLPGGWIGYGAYRVAKYKYKHTPDNDNTAATPEQTVKADAKTESGVQKPAAKKRLCPLSPRKPKP